MKISGKALPPRAALLLTFDFVVLVILAPLLFVLPLVAVEPDRSPASLTLGLLRLMAVGLLCQMILYYHELYNLNVVRVGRETLIQVMRAFGILFFLLALVSLLIPVATPVLSRTVMFAGIIAAATLLSRRLALPRRREQVLVVGAGDEVYELQGTINASPEWNMEISQIALPAQLPSVLRGMKGEAREFDRVIVTNAKAHSSDNLALLLDLKMGGLYVEDAQSFFERATGRVRVDQLHAHDCIFSEHYVNHPTKRLIKRVFDVSVASFLLLLAAPVMAVTALVIRMQNDGPIFFRQQRTGLFGRPFSIVKFRSMSPVKPGESTGWAGEETHRITALGRRLRKYRIDELPQLLNVLRGEMSLIGPRPEQPHLCSVLEEHIRFYRHRHSVLPGLTGWAQVRYHYGSSIEESRRKVEYDLFYVKHHSIWLDFAIALETVKVVLVGRGAM
jgi:exopolysaccharide biosynthesis polyprenyl glycosylphosphotransferase